MRLIAVLVLLAVAGCGSVEHAPLAPDAGQRDQAFQEPAGKPPPASFRTVASHLGERFWEAAPECVVILPTRRGHARDARLAARQVERAAARQAFQRFDRVIGPDRRDALENRMVLDLAEAGDRRRFARSTGCLHGVSVRPEGGMDWMLVWAEARVGVEVTLADLIDGDVLWQARHTARRGDGGLPISPLSFLMAAGAAAGFAQDGDVIPSLIDTALRRIFETLPDVRMEEELEGRTARALD